MAINKSNAAPWVKITIVTIAVLLVVALGGSVIQGLVAFVQTPGGTSTSGGTTGGLDKIAAEKGPQIAAIEQALVSDPASYTVLVALGNGYFDWALAVQQTGQQNQVASRAYWAQAVSAYQRALKIQPGDPNVETDLAIAMYYNAQVEDSIAQVERVLAAKPDFAPALFNAGIFYQSAGRNADAVRVLNAYLAADPQGQFGSPDQAREWLTQLRSAGAGTSAPATGSTPSSPTP